ncbi:polyprenyl synthetase family protein [Streptomyces sp. AK02-04a]|uniref:polyprenyl synthetase family protein n=1 Tax=Streptomyces sp. AK02-04a TaxID=3028649 RepID=UPI0029BF447F|nr:polyprenyl synthetase family protein [Streptomyces sp. AK02-04a]MDX3763131.1 polyprenyl synthetase family protein [Streptomyces sp. AK02-04a]
MTVTQVDPRADKTAIREAVDATLSAYLDIKQQAFGDPWMRHRVDLLRQFLAGGKRLRPLLCAAGWEAGGGTGLPGPVLRAAACLEMFHGFALIHDDVMDHSATRRGHPTLHEALAHDPGRAQGNWPGICGAILLGDLALCWSDELLHTAGLTADQLARALPLLDEMRTEVMYGQLLDIQATGHLTNDLEATLRIIRYKTAKYTVERPLHIGAALAGAPPATLAACSAFALPLGEAFQLRDDLLGVFGTARDTGKPTLDDLREGKNTPLMAIALSRADTGQAELLHRLVRQPDLDEAGAAAVRDVLQATGADKTVEQMITGRYELALDALRHPALSGPARATLQALADACVWRSA